MADSAYGLWPLVIVNTLLFAVFALSFFHPRTTRDWRAMGAYTRPYHVTLNTSQKDSRGGPSWFRQAPLQQ
jgi:hypothetical protein